MLTPGDKFKYTKEYLSGLEWMSPDKLESMRNYVFEYVNSATTEEHDYDEDDNIIGTTEYTVYYFNYIYRWRKVQMSFIEDDIRDELERTQILETFVARKLESLGIKING